MNPWEPAAIHFTNASHTHGGRRDSEFTAGWILIKHSVRGTAAHMNLGGPDIDDAVSVAAIKLWKEIPKGVTFTAPLLQTITRRGVIDHVEQLARHRDPVDWYADTQDDRQSWDDFDNDIADAGDRRYLQTTVRGTRDSDAPSAFEDLESIELTSIIEHAIRTALQRPKPMWAAMLQCILDGYHRWSDIAIELGWAKGTIRRNAKEMIESGILDDLRHWADLNHTPSMTRLTLVTEDLKHDDYAEAV